MNPHREIYSFAYSFQFNLVIAVCTITAWLFSREEKWMPMTPVSILVFVLCGLFIISTLGGELPKFSMEDLERNTKTMILSLLIFVLFNSRARIHVRS